MEPLATYFPNSKPASNEDLIKEDKVISKPLGQFWPFANSQKLKDF